MQRERNSSARRGDTPPAPARRAIATDQRIHDDIYSAIINRKIRPGTPLKEDALAGAFGVSRTIIRKALQRLSHEKLVDLVPNKGAFVAKPTVEQARQVFEARRIVECAVIEELANRLTDAEIGRLQTLVEEEEETALAPESRQQRVTLSGNFHRELANLARNAVLREFIHELISRTSLIIALYESRTAVPCSHNEHAEILEALKRQDPAKAALCMRRHLQHIEAQIDLADRPQKVDFTTLFKPVT